MDKQALLITDGECSFCQSAAKWLTKKFPGNWENFPSNTLDFSNYGLSKNDVDRQVWYLLPNTNGFRKYGGAKAIAKLLLQQKKNWIKPLALLAFLPISNLFSALVYRWVAKNRSKLGWIFK